MSHLSPSEWKEVIVAGTIWIVLMVIGASILTYLHINPGQWGALGLCCVNLAIAAAVGEALRHWFWKKFLKEPTGKAPPLTGQDQPPPQCQPPPRPAPRTEQVRTCRHCNGPMDPNSSYCPVCHQRN